MTNDDVPEGMPNTDPDVAEFHLYVKARNRYHADELVGAFKGPREKALEDATDCMRQLTGLPHVIPWARIALFEVVSIPVDLTAFHTGVQ